MRAASWVADTIKVLRPTRPGPPSKAVLSQEAYRAAMELAVFTGGEPGVVQCWDNGIGGITDNVFYGEIHATGTSVGAIVGTICSLNKNTLVDNNYYLAGCGTSKGIGSITTVDTKYKPSTLPKDTEYICTSDGYTNIFFKDGDYSREDDPVGKDADKLSKAVTNTALKDGTVVQWLNTSESSYHNWMQGTVGPILSNKAIAYDLEITGEINQHYVGDALNLSGLTLTAKWSDGTTTNVPLNDSDLKITGYDSGKHGQQTVTLQYGAAKVEIVVTVLYKEPEDITVTITLLGDKAHGSVTVDDGAAKALVSRGSSLLAVGIREVDGEFAEGDVLDVCDPSGMVVARGIAEADSDVLELAAGRRQDQIASNRLLANLAEKPAIHRDNLIVFA